MPYWRLFYHVVWATKGRQPFMEAKVEPFIHQTIRQRCDELGGHAFAVNGMPDHVHLVASIPPRLAVAQFVKVLKGSTSRYASLQYDMTFEWQAGYGVFSLSQRAVGQAIDYVTRQKEHHRAGSISSHLEHISDNDDGPRMVSNV